MGPASGMDALDRRVHERFMETIRCEHYVRSADEQCSSEWDAQDAQSSGCSQKAIGKSWSGNCGIGFRREHTGRFQPPQLHRPLFQYLCALVPPIQMFAHAVARRVIVFVGLHRKAKPRARANPPKTRMTRAEGVQRKAILPKSAKRKSNRNKERDKGKKEGEVSGWRLT